MNYFEQILQFFTAGIFVHQSRKNTGNNDGYIQCPAVTDIDSLPCLPAALIGLDLMLFFLIK